MWDESVVKEWGVGLKWGGEVRVGWESEVKEWIKRRRWESGVWELGDVWEWGKSKVREWV